jgi:3-dehydrosphinganine reductase
LRFEGNDDGIHVSVIYPPDTDTPMFEMERKQMLPECIALAGNTKPLAAQTIAAAYLRGLQIRKTHIFCDTSSRMLRVFKNNFPGLFWRLTNQIIKKARRSNELANVH